MDDFGDSAELAHGSHKSPVLVIIERHVLTRTCILSILKRVLAGFEIIEMATTRDLDRLSGRDVRLISLNAGSMPINERSIEDDLAVLAESFPQVPIVLLSNREDEATVSAAMRRGVRGFFPTSITVEVAIAGLRLVLAGGVYRPLPIDTNAGLTDPSKFHEVIGAENHVIPKTLVDLTPREEHVFAAMKLGLPNKLIAARLKLSENTVKMHIQHIMRKCSARNRTEAVLLLSRRLSGHNGGART